MIQHGKLAVVIVAAAECDRSQELGRRVLRLDELPGSDIEDILRSEVPTEHQYSLAETPD